MMSHPESATHHIADNMNDVLYSFMISKHSKAWICSRVLQSNDEKHTFVWLMYKYNVSRHCWELNHYLIKCHQKRVYLLYVIINIFNKTFKGIKVKKHFFLNEYQTILFLDAWMKLVCKTTICSETLITLIAYDNWLLKS